MNIQTILNIILYALAVLLSYEYGKIHAYQECIEITREVMTEAKKFNEDLFDKEEENED